MSNRMPETINVLSAPVRIEGHYTAPDNLMTVSITATAFVGRVSLLASIMSNPGENDWFVIPLTEAGYVEYPTSGTGRESSTKGFSFKGRYIWIRAKIDRDYLLYNNATQLQIASYGMIDRILLNL